MTRAASSTGSVPVSAAPWSPSVAWPHCRPPDHGQPTMQSSACDPKPPNPAWMRFKRRGPSSYSADSARLHAFAVLMMALNLLVSPSLRLATLICRRPAAGSEGWRQRPPASSSPSRAAGPLLAFDGVSLDVHESRSRQVAGRAAPHHQHACYMYSLLASDSS